MKCGRNEKKKKEDINWDWRDEWILIGSDVVSLFPSLTADRTAKAVRSQAEKIEIKWENVDTRWLCMYIHQNRELSSDLSQVEKFLPRRRKGKRGPEPGLSSKECLKRYLECQYENGELSSWEWPENSPKGKEINQLVAIMLEIAIKFFFSNFTYTFGGETFLQCTGGPIGARITMCIARLVMQEWWDNFKLILDKSSLKYLLMGIYVDDGRMVVKKLRRGERFVIDGATGLFKFNEKWQEEDIENKVNVDELTELEIKKQ